LKHILYRWFICLLVGFNCFQLHAQQKPVKEDVELLNGVQIDTTAKEEEKHITLYKKGLKLFDSTDYKGAISEFKKATRQKREFFEAYLKSAEAKIKLADYKGADKDLELARTYGPNDFDTYKLRGINYFLLKNYKESKSCLDSALQLFQDEKKDDAEFFYYRAKLMFTGKSYKTALEACDVALDMDAKYYDAMILKCEIRFAAKEYAYALKTLNETIAALPELKMDYNLYKMRAQTKFHMKDFRGSANDWNVYIDAIPKEEDAYINRAAALINCNDHTKAIIDLDEAIKINPKNHVSYCYRGLAKGSNKQIVEGIKDLDFSIKLKFDYAEAFVNRAALKMAAKDKQGACSDLQKADSLGNEMAPGLYDKYCK
jgi:tetratricopeptide (TPR) repeat protein